MTLPAPNKNRALASKPSTRTEVAEERTGWDPVEIWRTRVLLPRLAETCEELPEGVAPAPATIKLVRS